MGTWLGKLRWWVWRLVVLAVGVAVAGLLVAAEPTSASHTAGADGRAAGVIRPAAVNMVDCNGYSGTYPLIAPSLAARCALPHGMPTGQGGWGSFYDGLPLVEHDEPGVRFVSPMAGSGNAMSYGLRLPSDPVSAPTASGSVTDYGELSVAPWFGLAVCDPQSYPQNPCTPDSDGNSGSPADPGAAGSALMELQFYPPGFTPAIDNISCSTTQWCAALTIDSLECPFDYANCIDTCKTFFCPPISPCVEPVNFAYLQADGVPAGPPAPQDPTVQTFLGNSRTLKMNPGDVIKMSINDPPAGLTVKVTDLTAGKTGFMVASGQNGFADTSMADCAGHRFTFHAEYSTASPANQVPWAALDGAVMMAQEIGHGESCGSVTSKELLGTGSAYQDPATYQVCHGGTEGAGKQGEGPCFFDFPCPGSQTQGPAGPDPCAIPWFRRGCELSDGLCFAKGTRTAFVHGVPVKEHQAVTECTQTEGFRGGTANDFFELDNDFDGLSYRRDWPDGSPSFPQAFRYVGPFTNGHPYPQIQFQTDVAGAEALCEIGTTTGCTAPPIGAKFYPFWSMNNTQTLKGLTPAPGVCVWNFGNDITGITKTDFGKDKQYGKPDLTRYGGILTSPILTNPTLSTSCKPFHL